MFQEKISLKLLPIKIHYFLLNGALSGVIPILSVHAHQLGISPVSIGIIYTISRAITTLAKPAFGIIVDRFRNYRRILLVLMLCVLGTMAGICFIPIPAVQQFSCLNKSSELFIAQVDSCCTWNCTQVHPSRAYSDVKSEVDLSGHFKANATRYVVNFYELNLGENCGNLSASYQCKMACNRNVCDYGTPKTVSMKNLYLFATLLVICWTFYASASTLSDAACYNVLDNRVHLFGNQRMFGSIGWMMFSIIAGVLNNVISQQYDSNKYSFGFYLLMILIPMDLIVIGKLDLTKVNHSTAIFKDICKLLAQFRILCFSASVFFNGLFIGLSWSFLFLHLESLGANPLLLGMASMISCAAEIPFFRCSGAIIQKLGHLNTISLASIASGIRFMGYAYLNNPWWTIPLEILHGPGFAGFYAASTAYAKVIAPEGTAATMQGLVGATFEGLGVGAGGLLGGLAFGYYGGSTTFFWASILAFITGIGHTAVHKMLDIIDKSETATTD